MYCKNCGFENKDFANFCYKCGRPLKQLPPSPDQSIKQPQQPLSQQQQSQQQQYQQQFQQQPQPIWRPLQQQGIFNDSYTGSAKKKSPLPWIIAAVIIPMVLIAGVLFLFFKTPLADNVINALRGTTNEEPEDFSDVDDEPDIVVVPAITDVPTPAPADIKEANLDIWYISYGESNPVITDSINRLVADFPQYTVNVNWMEASAYKTELKIAAESGTMPDIFMTSADMGFYDNVRNGQLLDITDYMKKDNYKDRFLDAGIEQVTYRNRIYGVPGSNMSVFGIFYNKDIFNRLGLQEPATISELEQICDTLKADGTTPFELGNSVSFFGDLYFSCMAARKSGINPIVSAADGDINALKDGFIYAGNKIQEWAGKGYFEEGFNDTDDYTAMTNFCNGYGAMYLSGSWCIQTLQTEAYNPDNIGFFAFPAYSEGDAGSRIALGLIGGPFYCISSSCDNPEAAFRAIEYMNDDIAGEQYTNEYLLMPYKNYTPQNLIAREVMDTVYNTDAACEVLEVYLPTEAYNQYINNMRSLFDLSINPDEFYNFVTSGMP